MNVWVEEGDLLFYLSRSGTFDEHSTMLKQGRFRVRLNPNPFLDANDFRQELKLNEGYMEIAAGGTTIQLWADVFRPVVHLELESSKPVEVALFYENWRYKDRPIRKNEGHQGSYKWAPPKGLCTSRDSIEAHCKSLTFYHKNPEETVFDFAVEQQGLSTRKSELMNPLAHLTFGGTMWSNTLSYTGTQEGEYAGTDYRAWVFKSDKPLKREHIRIALHTLQAPDIKEWESGLARTIHSIDEKQNKKLSRKWWNDFWDRSYIYAASGKYKQSTRNYNLFRYMLGCNAYSTVPTKFNGGLFTFDPVYVDENMPFTPDYRKWGGGTMTAQNQRLLYWPMLKSGDFDLMKAQFDFYLRMLGNAELRTRHYWGHEGACFTEQIENFGLPNPAEYGMKRPEWFDKGLEYNAWLEYEWDTVLEFCQMILETERYSGADITAYIPLIESSLTFFEAHYRYLASRRGRKDLDGNGHLVFFPGSACETYKMAHNASSTIAALRVVLETYGKKPEMEELIPPIPLRTIEGREMIAPAKSWERINNIETPQLYPVFPWRIYGIGREGLEVARNTYLHDPDALEFRSHKGWKQDNIWAACLGLTAEADELTSLKLADGPHRFPAFWGPGYDWTPDHNHGGSGMIGLQEMLFQVHHDKLYLFPAWPVGEDVAFKLHAPGQLTVEAELKEGKVVRFKLTKANKSVTPQEAGVEVILCNDIKFSHTN